MKLTLGVPNSARRTCIADAGNLAFPPASTRSETDAFRFLMVSAEPNTTLPENTPLRAPTI